MFLEKFRLLLRKSSLARFFLILSFFILLGSFFFLSSWLSDKNPVISSLDPTIGNPGDILIIRGKNFGEKENFKWVEIGGERPTSSAYVQWAPTIIMVKIPPSSKGGLVYVKTKNKKSNPLLFTNQASIPIVVREKSNSDSPVITNLDTKKASIGSILIIRGKHFGSLRGQSQVCFSWSGTGIAQGIPTTSDDEILSTVVCSEDDFDYEFWSDQEIRVRVPDGAENGNVFIQSERGKSNNIYLEIADNHKRYTGKRTYAVSLGVDISNVTAARENTLFLRVPKPLSGLTQYSTETGTPTVEPFLADFQNIILHRLENISTGNTYTIKHSFIVTSFDIESAIRAEDISNYKNISQPFYSFYTMEDPLHPVNNEKIQNFVQTNIKKKMTPYLKAKALYDIMLNEFKLKPVSGKEPDLAEAINKKRGTPWEIAVLYTTMARAAGIPAVTCSGFFIEKNQTTHPHWWTEIYFEDYGWFPVDPTLSMGLQYSLFNNPTSVSNYYFGNTDSQHILISRGWREQKPMTVKSSVITRNQTYSFQNIWEETVGNITRYSSFWSNLSVTGIY